MPTLTQARLLSLIGFQDASAMMARRHIESCMRALVPKNSCGHMPRHIRTAGSMLGFLWKERAIDKYTRDIAKKSLQIANDVVHGQSISRKDARRLLKDTRTLEIAFQGCNDSHVHKSPALVRSPLRRIPDLITAQ